MLQIILFSQLGITFVNCGPAPRSGKARSRAVRVASEPASARSLIRRAPFLAGPERTLPKPGNAPAGRAGRGVAVPARAMRRSRSAGSAIRSRPHRPVTEPLPRRDRARGARPDHAAPGASLRTRRSAPVSIEMTGRGLPAVPRAGSRRLQVGELDRRECPFDLQPRRSMQHDPQHRVIAMDDRQLRDEFVGPAIRLSRIAPAPHG